MASTRACPTAGSRLVMALSFAALLSGCAASPSRPAALAPPLVAASTAPPPLSPVPLAVPAALVDRDMDLRAGPVTVPMQLQLPSIGVDAAVVGVGITPENVMDAPTGPAQDPIWQQAFWYRGSAVPGVASTAVIAGHINGPRGRPAVFAQLDRLQPGDPVVVRDTRSGLDVRFEVRESKTYRLDQTGDPALLSRIYGAGPVGGTDPQPSADGLSHLTLITCAGTYVNGTHDHRLVVSATRIG